MLHKTNPATSCIGRLAPSPTGAQHVGNARTYLLAWLSVRLQGGQLRLRIEDIDSPRVKPWAIEQTIDDLRWLGLNWDELEIDEPRDPQLRERPSPPGVWLQTDRLAIYERYLLELLRAGRLYPCYCSRKDIEAAASAPHREDHLVRYPDTCRQRSATSEIFPHLLRSEQANDGCPLQDMSSLARPFAWRFRSQDEPLEFEDLVCGSQRKSPHEELGDFVIAKSNGHVAYQLAVVVDDHEMGVTEVIRGDDLIPSTFWQLEIYQALGWVPPKFGHVPLVVGPDGRRLAKRHGDTRLSEIRRQGHGPERLLGELAVGLGLLPYSCPITARELLELVQSTLASGTSTGIWGSLSRQPYVLTQSTWQALLGN
jgi:glutamyl-tRNA synthetase